jgi:hypothetical protein
VEGLILHVASIYNLIFVFFFSKNQSTDHVVVVAFQKGSCENQDSKTSKMQPILTHTLLKPSMLRHFIEEIFCFICLHFFVFFEDDIQN